MSGMDFTGQRIAVTGAAGTLGRAVVTRLAAAGAEVTGLDRAAAAPGAGEVRYIGGIDLADEAASTAAFTSLGAPLHGLANVAGGFCWETLADGALASWEAMFRLNLMTAVSATRAALPFLRTGRGAVVNIGAAATLKAAAGMGAYAASKSGIARLTEALAEEEKPHGIRVNAVLPSIIDTPANRAGMPEAEHAAWVQPGELAEIIAFLLSGAASAITGACIPVTGRM